MKPKFYLRFGDNVISWRLKNTHYLLLENLKSFYEKITFTVENNLRKFLDTQLLLEKKKKKTEVYCTANKFALHWKLQIPNRYKRNSINGDLYRSRRINANFYHEENKIRNKFLTAGYSIINDFESKEHDLMISSFLFNSLESKPIVLIDIPFCNKNEKVSKQLLEKLKTSNKVRYDFTTVWKTKKVRQLLHLKEKNTYPSCSSSYLVCSCKEIYTGETRRNIVSRWNGNEKPNKVSEPAKHLFQHHDYVF